jgi:hypothetical protein
MKSTSSLRAHGILNIVVSNSCSDNSNIPATCDIEDSGGGCHLVCAEIFS